MSDDEQGVYRKYQVDRTDGRSEPGEKHHGCRYFVLDIDHDPHARAALEAYADSCKEDFPALSSDLSYAAEKMEGDRDEFSDRAELGFKERHSWGDPDGIFPQ